MIQSGYAERLDAAVHKQENSAAALLSSDLVCEHTV